ncbi:hypothetical protein [Marinomonas sp.]|uniref:hypothetical protein n=1 Tax=Marinomonas sp. TaxID=1904862 RepID=UPI003BAB57CA
MKIDLEERHSGNIIAAMAQLAAPSDNTYKASDSLIFKCMSIKTELGRTLNNHIAITKKKRPNPDNPFTRTKSQAVKNKYTKIDNANKKAIPTEACLTTSSKAERPKNEAGVDAYQTILKTIWRIKTNTTAL